jgi:hypothetical protein
VGRGRGGGGVTLGLHGFDDAEQLQDVVLDQRLELWGLQVGVFTQRTEEMYGAGGGGRSQHGAVVILVQIFSAACATADAAH